MLGVGWEMCGEDVWGVGDVWRGCVGGGVGDVWRGCVGGGRCVERMCVGVGWEMALHCTHVHGHEV